MRWIPLLCVVPLAACVDDLGEQRLRGPLAGDAVTRCIHAGAPDAISLDFGEQTYWLFRGLDPQLAPFATGAVTSGPPDRCAGELAPTVAAVLELDDDERAFEAGDPDGRRIALWPVSGVVVDGTGWIFYRKVIVAGLWDQTTAGTGVARVDGPGAVAVRARPGRYPDDPTLSWRYPDHDWGDAVTIDGGQVVVAGCRSGDAFGARCKLARAAAADLADPAAWEFRGLDGWAEGRNQAIDLVDAADEVSLGWNDHVGEWVLLYARPLDNQVVGRTAATVDGDWGLEQEIFTGDPPASFWIHGVTWHRALDRDGGRILGVTYGSAPAGGEAGLRWVEVTLP